MACSPLATVTGTCRPLRGAGPGASRRIGLGVVAGAAEQGLREVEGAPAPVAVSPPPR